jgi:predicted ATP-grasp superfamily ATP-dependent carboligase
VAAHGECRLLGVTRQLVGSEWGAGPFSYAGSIGPLSLPAHKNATFRRIGDCLAGEFQLVGVFGVDAIVNDAGVWPVEVNPRYPASAEVLERAGNFSAISMHAAACADGLLPSEPLFAERIVGKAILFATLKQCVPLELTEWTERVNRDATWPRVADIPAAGNMLVPGAPVLTLLSEGDDAQQLETKLQQRLAETRQYLG